MNIPQLVQNALATFLKTQNLGDIPVAQVYRGIQHEIDDQVEKQILAPCIICNCQESEFIANYSGNQTAKATISVVSNADDTSHDDHQQRVTIVWNLLLTDTIAADLSNAISDFTASLVVPKEQGWEIAGRRWISHLNLAINCAPFDYS